MRKKPLLHITLLIFIGLIAQAKGQEGVRVNYVDSFRNQFLNCFEYCEHIEVKDTLFFLQQSYISFINYDNVNSFNNLFFCFEKGYMNLPNPDRHHYPLEEFYRKRDIRFLFLFYVENYIFNKNRKRIDKFCQIKLYKIKKHEEQPLYGGNSNEIALILFQKLIKVCNSKNFKRLVIQEKKMSPLEYIGYQFEVQKVGSGY